MELHVTPDLHRRERGVRIPEMSLALERAARRLRRERGFVMRFIYDHVRSAGVEACERTVEDALDARALGVVALGLSGHEHGGNASDVASAIRWAQDNGLAFVAHAGELRGPSSIREVVELGARRIGHGIQCLQDPALVSMLVERQIALEVCLSSNQAVGCTPNLAAHPLPRLLASGLVVVLGTDDPSLFKTTLSHEYELAARKLGLADSWLRRMMTNSIEHSLASREEKATLRTDFEASLRPLVVEG
jgi:adenosine deaminase